MDHELLVDEVLGRISEFKTLRSAARHYQINPGLLSRVLAGGDSPTVRRALGIPLKTVGVEPCPTCGEAHTIPWCIKDLGEPKKPRKRTGKPSNRLTIHKQKPALAAAAIRRHMTVEDITALVEELLK